MLFKTRSTAILLALATAFALLLGSAQLPQGKAYADSSLRLGDEGQAVKELQQLLKKHDCYEFDEITGYYGTVTENGVRKFQTQNGLKVDGIAGEDTIKKLKERKSSTLKNPNSLCLGMKGDKVKEVQRRLKELGLYTESVITGYYGPVTEKAVKAFQEASGMTADGIVGDKTRAALNAKYNSSTMIPGMMGESVKKLQARLKTLGYFTGTPSGLYGQLTEKAVTYFQKLNGLKQDGICGSGTYKAVFAKNAKSEKEARRKPVEPKPTPKYTDTPGQSAAGQEKGQAIVAEAKKHIGKRYVYGGNGPNVFDCTGLTCFVYKKFGISLPRSAKNQGMTNYGIKITDRKKLMPGDLVFFRKGTAATHHAGIYIGDGNFIHAPYTGTVIRISSVLTARDFAWGRRVFK